MASPPQGFVVVLPGEITQADLDPNQPPAKLSAYPLVAGKDVQPYPEKQLVNDNSGNIATIIGNDTSTVTIPLSKLAALVASFNGRTGAVVPASGDYNQSQITHENGSIDEAELANDNSGTIATIIGNDTSSVTIPLSKLAPLVSSFNGRTGAVVPVSTDYYHITMQSIYQGGGVYVPEKGVTGWYLVLSDVVENTVLTDGGGGTIPNYVLGNWVCAYLTGAKLAVTNNTSGVGFNDYIIISL